MNDNQSQKDKLLEDLQRNINSTSLTSMSIPSLLLFAKNTKVKNLEHILRSLMREFPTLSTGEILKDLEISKGFKSKEIINSSGISKDYYSKIITGKRRPSRNKTIQLSFGLKLKPEEACELLKKMGHNELYLRNEFDFIIYAALAQNLSYYEVEDLLDNLGYDTLNKEK